MKRICILLIFSLTLSVFSCDNSDILQTVSEKDSFPEMLFVNETSDNNLLSVTPDIRQIFEDTLPNSYDESCVKTINNLFGYEIRDLHYRFTGTRRSKDHQEHFYSDEDMDCHIFVNAETGDVDFCGFQKFFKEYTAYTEEIDIKTAQHRAEEFIKTFFGHRINFDEFILTEAEETVFAAFSDIYFFQWEKHVYSVQTSVFSIYIDRCGNVVQADLDDRARYEDMIPDYTEEEYLEGCKRKLQELYSEIGVDAEFENLAIYRSASGIEIKSVFFKTANSYCVECIVRYDIIYPDGSTDFAYTNFALPYAEKTV